MIQLLPPDYEVILQVIQAVGGGLITPAILVYFVMKMKETNEKLKETTKALNAHRSTWEKGVESSNARHNATDNKFIQLITFMISTNNNLNKAAKRQLSEMLQV